MGLHETRNGRIIETRIMPDVQDEGIDIFRTQEIIAKQRKTHEQNKAKTQIQELEDFIKANKK
ncbi:hypothetical protein [Bacillus sp. AFS031507]|uniref:hypothetical protein n=1 Tax=Bacillus sp. AFS031507 TaxID=2033496 RepID=UPI000BFC4E07|nr:hypothetical protein [Bacillus sp. AFS031507]PGY13194.1 hypothetical protein COE25_08540 [Bacillus sp. AFS031507]